MAIDRSKRQDVAKRITDLGLLTGRTTEELAQKALVSLIVFERASFGYDISDEEFGRINDWLQRYDVSAAGAALRMARDAAGFDLVDVEKETGLSQYSVSKWERGVRAPRVPAVRTLFELYSAKLPELRVEWLLLNDGVEVRAMLLAREVGSE